MREGIKGRTRRRSSRKNDGGKRTITRNSRLRLPSGFARSQTSVGDLTLDYLFPLLYDSLLPLRYSPTLSVVVLALPRRERRFALCRMIIYPNALPSSTILHGLTSARTARIKSRRYLYFFLASSPLASLYPLCGPSRSFSLSLLPQVSILISAEYTPSRRCRRRRRRRARVVREYSREVCANEIVDIRQTRE